MKVEECANYKDLKGVTVLSYSTLLSIGIMH